MSVAWSASKRSTSRLELEMHRMKEELAMKERQLEEDKLIRKKQLEIEQALALKQFEQEKELQEKRLAQEREMLQKRLAKEVEFQQKQRALQEKFQRSRYELMALELGCEDGAVGGEFPDNDFGQVDRQRVHDWLKHHFNPLSKPVDTNKKVNKNPAPLNPVPLVPRSKSTPDGSETPKDSAVVMTGSNEERSSASTVASRDGPGPTKAQRAARQVLSKRLPMFSGRIEEWPLFYSSFINSTEACGFSHVENLVRLRECLKGQALEIVAEASEVILVVEPKAMAPHKGDKPKPKEKGFVHTHSDASDPVVKYTIHCRICKQEGHRVRNCDEFRQMNCAERLKLKEQYKLCERCLNDNEGWCTFKITCNIGTCREHHHPLVHREVIQRTPICPSTEQHHAHNAEQRWVIFRIVPITLHYRQRSVSTFAYLDEGSSMTLLEESLVDELKTCGRSQPLTLQWTGNIVRQEVGSMCLSLQVSGSEACHLNEARTVKKLYLPRQRIDFKKIVSEYHHLQGLYRADHLGEQPRVLIGLNNIHLLAPLESRIGNINEPIVAATSDTNKELHDVMREYFAVEEVAITVSQLPESEEVRRAKDLLQSTTVRVDGRFETGLLWKQDDFELPDSYPMAVNRLCSFERRLKKKQTKQYAHKMTEEEMAVADPRKIWYLPLSVVINPKKPGKVRLVWDAAAQVKGTSLNSMLLTGPDLLTVLPAVIQQFRERPVAFKADIREMYHQYRIRKADKHAQCFLFRTDTSSKPDVYVMDEGTFGAACSPASAQYVKNLNASQHADRFPDATKAIVRRHYVDDYLESADTVEEAITRAKEIIHARTWRKGSGVPLQAGNDGATERVLGIIWCPQEDVFTFSTNLRDDLLPYLIDAQWPTKRIALRCVMSLFDPLGFLPPFTIHGKILLQRLWCTGCEWDQDIDDECYARWSQWIFKLPLIEDVKIPQCYLQGAPPEAYDTLLHVFVDASEQAYGGVAFFRVVTDDGPRCSLAIARTKVAPLKQLSIPRMELQGAVLGARLLNSVEINHELKVTKRVLWTDSQNVLSWIRSDQRKYKPFVAFRIGEILLETKIDEWRWVPTKDNVADLLTKWDKGPSLDSDGPWFTGPQFLQLPEEMWPVQRPPAPNTTEELRACHMFHTAVVEEPIINVNRFSRWNVLLRTICCVYRFISNCRRRIALMPIEVIPDLPERTRNLVGCAVDCTIVPLKQEEFELAEIVLWKIAQRESFA
ncbi:uncharacterized protein LOC135707451 [Ochlerotatus camptorhynchus]|uniref:uncharacterized protein LOC135707451 n=1 Tax=Ochlerotatus camptorhynchus TaxID=644619 RepID=UPI0031DE64A9